MRNTAYKKFGYLQKKRYTKEKGSWEDFAFCNYVPPSSEQSQTNTDGTMESNTKSAFAENYLFETSDNIVQKK